MCRKVDAADEEASRELIHTKKGRSGADEMWRRETSDGSRAEE